MRRTADFEMEGFAKVKVSFRFVVRHGAVAARKDILYFHYTFNLQLNLT